MKFTVTFKTPDVLQAAIAEAINENIPSDMSGEEAAELANEREDQALDVCRRWFTHYECVTIEVDTARKTARVVENGR